MVQKKLPLSENSHSYHINHYKHYKGSLCDGATVLHHDTRILIVKPSISFIIHDELENTDEPIVFSLPDPEDSEIPVQAITKLIELGCEPKAVDETGGWHFMSWRNSRTRITTSTTR